MFIFFSFIKKTGVSYEKPKWHFVRLSLANNPPLGLHFEGSLPLEVEVLIVQVREVSVWGQLCLQCSTNNEALVGVNMFLHVLVGSHWYAGINVLDSSH